MEVPQVHGSDFDVRGRCDGGVSSIWWLQPGGDALVNAEWERFGGLGEEDLIDEIGLSYESMDMLATMVDPSRSYMSGASPARRFRQ